MTEKVDQNHPRFRVRGETGSEQNKLRGELYDAALKRIRDGYEEGNYFEVISLVESILSDRVGAILQTLHHYDEEQFPTESLGVSAQRLKTVIKAREIKLGARLKKELGRLIHWSSERNVAVHGFVIVNTSNVENSVDDRLEQLRATAERGSEICRTFLKLSASVIEKLKTDQSSK